MTFGAILFTNVQTDEQTHSGESSPKVALVSYQMLRCQWRCRCREIVSGRKVSSVRVSWRN